MRKSSRDYFDFVTNRCDELSVRLKLVNKPYVITGGMSCGGYFDASNLILCLGMDSPEGIRLGSLAHEANHMEQWAKKKKVWTDFEITGGLDIGVLISLWLKRLVELNDKQLTEYIRKSQNLELDCEKMAVKVIRKWGLDINIDRYIQMANAYVKFYEVMKRERKWYKRWYLLGQDRLLLDSMPTEFQRRSWYNTVKGYDELYQRSYR